LREPLNVSLVTAFLGGTLMFGLVSNPSKGPDQKKKRFQIPKIPIKDFEPSSRESSLIFLSLFFICFRYSWITCIYQVHYTHRKQ